MKYVCCKEYRKNAFPMLITEGTSLQSFGKEILFMGRLVCFTTSQNAYDHFARDDDGKGRLRFSLTREILSEVVLAKAHGNDQAIFRGIRSDPQFRKMMTDGYWNQAFYEADVKELERLLASSKEANHDLHDN